VFWEKVGMRGELVAPESLSTIKKDTKPFNFQSNEPFLGFYDKDFNKNLQPGDNL
jgi:hypothetical protein